MKTLITTLSTILVASSAVAHPGHIAPAAGHSHGEVLVALVLLSIAVAALWRFIRA